MTTLDELLGLIASTDWFARVGMPDFAGRAGYLHLPNLDEWRAVTGILPDEPPPRVFAEGMERLPTSQDEEDPVRGPSLKARATAVGRGPEISAQATAVYKATLVSLRAFDGHPMFKVGPHDFAGGARGGALYAARQAAYEILLREAGFWCRAVGVYGAGHWAFGMMPDGAIVVL